MNSINIYINNKKKDCCKYPDCKKMIKNIMVLLFF